MTDVTIILPTYERARFLSEAIVSALRQTERDFVLLIGDNSRDAATEAVVRAFDDPRIRYRRHATNLGAQGNWLELVRSADTPFVATLHDDDVWHPDFLERLLAPMRGDPELAMAFGDFMQIDERGQALHEATRELSAQTRRDRMPPGRIDYALEQGLRLAAVWNSPNVAICAVVRRSEILALEFPDAAAPLYDLWINYQLACRLRPLYFVAEQLADYRVHGGSTTSRGFVDAEDFVFQTILNDNRDAGPVLDEIRQYWATIRWGRAVRQMDDPAGQERSRREFRAAAAHLRGGPRMVAALAATSGTAWSVLRAARAVKRRQRAAS